MARARPGIARRRGAQPIGRSRAYGTRKLDLSIVSRSDVVAARRLVVKVGSSSLATSGGGLSRERLDALVAAMAARRATGCEVILVSSGAIAAGLAPLGLPRRPRDLATQQAAASVGQGALVAAYADSFGAHDIVVGQVLLTVADVTRRSHYVNARRTLEKLIAMGAVPIVNENDTVATQEIRFGDNDRLAALVAHVVRADALVLLSDVDGLYDGPPSQAGSRRIESVADPSALAGIELRGKGSGVGTGGMVTKVEAAGIASAAGIPTLLTSAAHVADALGAACSGTLFAAQAGRPSSRLLWLRHATTPSGRLIIDDGAVRAVVQGRKSLLPAGINAVEGRFVEGDPVDVCRLDGRVVARGLVNYAAEELPAMLGRSTRDLARDMGEQYEREVIHRDDMVLL